MDNFIVEEVRFRVENRNRLVTPSEMLQHTPGSNLESLGK